MVGQKYIAYYRVSTAEQGRSGLGLEAQRSAVLAWLGGGKSPLASFTEVESGSARARPQLAAAMAKCRLTGAKLVIAKLDRLSRSVAFLSALMESDVEFVCCDNEHATKFTLHILAAVAQHERELISTRTKAALAEARARGTVLGGWRATRKDGSVRDPAAVYAIAGQARRRNAAEFAAAVLPIITEMRGSRMTLTEISNSLNEQGVRTRRGGTWHPATVFNLLKRAP